MRSYRYLIIGGGMTGDAAVRGIRQVDPDGTIALLGAEFHPPYDRPPLSKGLWKGKPLEGVWRSAAAEEATLRLGRSAETLDPARKEVRDDHGTPYRYEKLLLATGGTASAAPLRFRPGPLLPHAGRLSRPAGWPPSGSGSPSSAAALSARKSPPRWPSAANR